MRERLSNLAGRFVAPNSERDPVARPELEARLLSCLSAKSLCLVTAPAGSGKSMIMSRLFRLCRDAGMITIWLGCEDGDGESGLWLQHVASALTHGAPRSGKRANLTVDELAGSIRRLSQPTALFIDNFHLAECAEVNSAVAQLIRLCGPNFHIMLASRRVPAINLARLRLQSAVGEFGRKDLAVTGEELPQFLGLDRTELPDHYRDALLNLTDGWAAALQFIRLLLEDGAALPEIVENLAGAGENIRLYLYEEVFATLPPAMQDYLLSIGHLDRVSADLGFAVTGSDNAFALYRELLDRKLFVIPLDRDRSWVKLHSVFRDFLIVQGRRDRQQTLPDTLLTAAHWHWAKGDWLEAVGYALDAGDHELGAKWLQACGEKVITDRGEISAFRTCCQRIIDAGTASFDLILWMVWTAAFSMSWMEASDLLSRHLDRIEDDRAETASRLELLRTLLTFFAHDFSLTIERAGRWWDKSDEDSPFDRATVASMLTFSHKAMLRRSQARPWLDRARAEIARVDSPYGRAWVHATSANMALTEGKAEAARLEIERALGETGNSSMAASILEPVLAFALYELDHCAEAAVLAEKHVGGADGCAALEIAICSYRVLATVKFRTHGAGAALNLLESWRDIVLRRYGIRGEAMLDLLKCDIISRVSQERRAELVVRFGSLASLPGETWSPDLIEWYRLISARTALGDGRPQDALGLVRNISISAHHDGRSATWVEAGLIRASAQRASGSVAKGEKALIEAVSHAASLGMRRSVLDHALMLRPFGTFLAGYLDAFKHIHADERELITRLTDEMGVGPRGERLADEQSPVEALTRQEARMLALLAEGLSNAEICDRLILSTATVKWHVYNLFQKLGVHSRTAAVREGRSLGLLD